MIHRKFMRTRQLIPGMKIDQAVVDRMGRILIKRNTELDEYLIDSLIKLGIMTVYIQEGEYEPDDYLSITSQKALNEIEKNRKDDPPKVSISDSVRSRIATGIQAIYNNSNSEEMTSQTISITDSLMEAIDQNDAMAIDIGALKTSDEYTFKHSVDVATISMILAKNQGMDQQQVHEIGIAGLLHDLGKTQIPPEILNKPARLDEAEFEVMKKHPVYSYRMIEHNDSFSKDVKLAVLQHHEKTNCTGYPIGCGASDITPYAKILSVADIYDALITERPYKSAYSQRDAVEMIMSMTGELDFNSINTFMHSMILYPVDSIVTLSNGEIARVVKNTPDYILRPTVVGLKSGKVYNLGEDLSCASIIIL